MASNGPDPFQEMLEFACKPAAWTRGWCITGGSRADDIAHAYLDLEVVAGGFVVVGKEHQDVVGDHICFIGVAFQHHLSADRLLRGRNSDFFPFFINDQAACYA